MSAMERPSYKLRDAEHRKWVGSLVATAPEGYIVTIDEPTRTKEQNRLLHSALTDIAKQVTWHGKKFNVVTWKRLCMASYLREKGEQPELIPALDGNGFDVIFEKTSQLSVKQLSELLSWCYVFGAQHEVKWKF